MIVAYITDPHLRAALLRAAHSEEDVVWDPELALNALEVGYPRLAVYFKEDPPPSPWVPYLDDVPSLVLRHATLARWDRVRLDAEIPQPRVEYLTRRLTHLVEQRATNITWVDRTLADLSRAAGAPLPPAFRGFARRVLEFPSHYTDLFPVAEACGISRGALKARFRRRGLPSPSTYLRWFRMMASAYALADRRLTVAQVASRMGFTSDGNFCRAMVHLTRLTPSEVRTVRGWNRLLISFAWTHLGVASLEAWEHLEELFLRRSA
ncbi:MAG: helix-turn-helix domain-containing protein [Gemmatimonadota bacterium]